MPSSTTAEPSRMREPELTLPQLPQSASASRVCLCRSVTDFHGQQLVDAPAIEIDDLEAPTLYLDAIADIRYPAELAEQEACNRLVVTGHRQLEPEQRSKLDGRHPPRDQIRTVVASDGRRFRRTLLGVKTADDRFQDVCTGHHALEHAIFVMDQPHMDGGVAQDGDDVPRIEKLRNDRRRADQLGDIRRLLRQIAI